jgi:glycosyltransferase involved in cell wall biosynthesis
MHVSIVVPTYNRKKSLKDTLDSLIRQDYPKEDYEIIVCDDGSTDDTSEFVKTYQLGTSYKVRYYRQKNSGPAAARNLGIKKAQGDIIGFIDDDCIAVDKWITCAINEFNKINVAGVQGPTIPLGKMEIAKKIFNYARTSDVTEQNDSYATCNIFYRKKLLFEVGLFDENFPRPCWGEDTDLGNKIILKGYNIVFNENVTVYHEIQYIPFHRYLVSLKKYQGRAYLVKKYPFMRNKYPLKLIGVKSHLYPIFVINLCVMSMAHILFGVRIQYIYILLVPCIILYFWGRVLLDRNYIKYLSRIAFFPRYILIDTIGLFYTLKGCVRFKTFLL